jgi:hypothetical protein
MIAPIFSKGHAFSRAINPRSRITSLAAEVSANFRHFLLVLLVLSISTTPAHAHVGNKDVYQTLTAGPYKLFITVRTPSVIPGIATIEVRSTGAPISSLTITPLLLTGEASRHPPTPDPMKLSPDDPAFYTGSLWLMGQGSWQVRFAINGTAGPAEASIPVPAVPIAMLRMDRPMGILLSILGVLLLIGIVGIVVAAMGESRLPPGIAPDARLRRRAKVSGVLALGAGIAAIVLGGWWWNVEAAGYAAGMHRNSQLHATLSGDTLSLRIGDVNLSGSDRNPKFAVGAWIPVKTEDLLLDHGHPMHLYAIRTPQMDAVFHLHPEPTDDRTLTTVLPAMPPGTYKLFGDVVFLNGFPETEVATLTIPASLTSLPLSTEDASASPPPLSSGELGPRYKLPDGYTMAFDHPATLTANTAYLLRFHLLDPTGHPAPNMRLYLGMAGHAAFVKSDFSTFAHTHPDGSAAMPAVMLADASTAAADPTAAPMDSMTAPLDKPLSSTVEFPYGFPSPGRYRIFIQMKHDTTVETGVFDVDVH